MGQRSEALRLASIRKKNQINEVQTAKDIQMKQQQDRIQKELIKSQKQEEAALQGLEKLRLKRIERKHLKSGRSRYSKNQGVKQSEGHQNKNNWNKNYGFQRQKKNTNTSDKERNKISKNRNTNLNKNKLNLNRI